MHWSIAAVYFGSCFNFEILLDFPISLSDLLSRLTRIVDAEGFEGDERKLAPLSGAPATGVNPALCLKCNNNKKKKLVMETSYGLYLTNRNRYDEH